MSDKTTCEIVNEKVKKVEDVAGKLLGKNVKVEQQYNPNLLVPFSREESLDSCEINLYDEPYMFYGFDLWNMWELRFKLNNGKSIQKVGKLIYDAHSPMIIESKSMKLYFFSQMKDKLGETESTAINSFTTRCAKDLTNGIQTTAFFRLYSNNEVAEAQTDSYLGDVMSQIAGQVHRGSSVYITDLDKVEIPDNYKLHSELPEFHNQVNYDAKNILKAEKIDNHRTELFTIASGKSNCLITHQPDFCSDFIVIHGKVKVDELALFDYLQTFENVNRFHESTTHTVFDRLIKLVRSIDPDADVSIISAYTRRGGIDINPFRTTNQDFYTKIYNHVSSNPWTKTWNQ